MKLSKLIFDKEENDIDKFNELDLDKRSIVFYSEDISSFVYFEQIIRELTEKMGYQICYMTSAKDDPILKNENKNIRSFYIGDSEIVKLKFFLGLRARVLILTMPDLGTYHIKRSKTFPVHYVHVFHAMNSTHRNYRKGAFDHFDSIFCAGPHHVEEIKSTEQLYNLKQKNLVSCGYGLLDKLQKSKPLQNQEMHTKDGRKRILVAPSWGKKGLLETKGLELVKILLDAGYHVTVRPHPMTIRKWPKIIKTIKNEFKDNTNFEMETDVSSFESLYSAYGLISDWSGIGFEYAFVCERPVIYVDVPKKAHNKEYEKIGLVPFEISIRDKIGEIISNQNLEKLPGKIESLYGQISDFKDKIQKIRDSTISNIGKSGHVAANEIIRIINEKA